MEEKNTPMHSPKIDAWLNQSLNEAIHADSNADTKIISQDDLELERILQENRASANEQAPAATPEIPQPVDAASAPEPAKQPETPQKAEPVKKAAKKHKKITKTKKKDPFGLPQFGATLIWLALILVIGLSLGRTLWAACTDVFAFGKVEYNATISISKNDSIDDVANMLHEAKLIRYPKLFRLFAVLTDKDEQISAGSFELNSQLDYNAMINAMTGNAAARKTVEIMFPEGYTCAQIFHLLEEEGVCNVTDMENCLKDESVQKNLRKYWFLDGIELGAPNCLEGFLFPDTYNFYINDDPERVLQKFLNAFDSRFTDRMKTDFENMQKRYIEQLTNNGYTDEYIDAHALTIHKIVIIASLIEKETANDDESYIISSVIYNRLTNPGQNPFLNIDAALVYALDGKTELSEADKQVDSPYNTYMYQGLIPGAISNPGSNSLSAAMNPEATNYLYYALDPKADAHKFFTNYQDHLNFLNTLG